MREVLTCPGCLQAFGATSEERYEQVRAAAGDGEAVTLEHPRFGELPIAKPDPAGGYRCPRCNHVVA
jgi:hypothetical protein